MNKKPPPEKCDCGHNKNVGRPPTEKAPHYIRPDGVWCAICNKLCWVD